MCFLMVNRIHTNFQRTLFTTFQADAFSDFTVNPKSQYVIRQRIVFSYTVVFVSRGFVQHVDV